MSILYSHYAPLYIIEQQSTDFNIIFFVFRFDHVGFEVRGVLP